MGRYAIAPMESRIDYVSAVGHLNYHTRPVKAYHQRKNLTGCQSGTARSALQPTLEGDDMSAASHAHSAYEPRFRGAVVTTLRTIADRQEEKIAADRAESRLFGGSDAEFRARAARTAALPLAARPRRSR